MAIAEAPNLGQQSDRHRPALRNQADVAAYCLGAQQLAQVQGRARCRIEDAHAVRATKRNARAGTVFPYHGDRRTAFMVRACDAAGIGHHALDAGGGASSTAAATRSGPMHRSAASGGRGNAVSEAAQSRPRARARPGLTAWISPSKPSASSEARIRRDGPAWSDAPTIAMLRGANNGPRSNCTLSKVCPYPASRSSPTSRSYTASITVMVASRTIESAEAVPKSSSDSTSFAIRLEIIMSRGEASRVGVT